MKKYILILFIFSQALFCFAQSEKEKAIIQLLELTNSKAMAAQAYELIIPQIKTLVPSVPDEWWDMFRENMDFDGLIMDLIPIYDKYYTLEDIQGMIAFYESPVGRKVTEVTPKMTAESMAVGQEWGRKIAEKILESIQESGYLDT